MLDRHFHPIVAQWFRQKFGEPTEPQRLGWPEIASGRHTLIAAPTGSGKTLAAFLACIDRLFRESLEGTLDDTTHVLYISPLKALSNDIRRNLEVPLQEIQAAAIAAGYDPTPIVAKVRTGDTPASERQAMSKRPPHILVTTPESLYILLTSPKARDKLRTIKTVIVDEIHALARDKRGSHLTLSLERLAAICPVPPVRIGLSATQRPMDEIAKFLVGNGNPSDKPLLDTNCRVIDVGHLRTLDLDLELTAMELAAICSNEAWAEVYERLIQLIHAHRSTLIFVNTRRMAEKVAHQLTEMLGADAVASHHGSLSKEIRLSAEERLKNGQLKAIVATASLELGIDVGYIDLVCQIGSPRAIATVLQRVGRSGHYLGGLPKGRLFPLTRDELLECLSLVKAVRCGDLDKIEIPESPLDILAQQIIASAACEEWREDDLFTLCRRAYPFRNLDRATFDEIMAMLSDGLAPSTRKGSYLHRDQINGTVKGRKNARLAAITSGGAIPEAADLRVVTEDDRTFIGMVNEDFAIESMAGDVFVLGTNSWRIISLRGGEVRVADAQGAPASIPFWHGDAPGRTIELSHEISKLREEVANRVRLPGHVNHLDPDDIVNEVDLQPAMKWLKENCGASEWASRQAARYVAAEKAAIGVVPTDKKIVFERFFDESGGMQLVIHAPLGARINRAWGLSLRKRFCRSFDFELQAAADDDGIVLSLGPQHSFPTESLFKMISTENGEYLLTQALIAAPMFQTRWRWNVTRSLAILRQRNGKKVPPQMQRFQADDLLSAVFPAKTGCFENHHGDTEIPNHPLVRQTVYDCLHEAMDLPRWMQMLKDVQSGEIEFIARETREPSPFTHQLLNSNPYTFLDPAPLEERRARAVAIRRTLKIESVSDLGRLDPEAILLVMSEAWPVVRDADELHDALLTMGLLLRCEGLEWGRWFEQLCAKGRATLVQVSGKEPFWIASERWPLIQTIFPTATATPVPVLPESLQKTWESAEALLTLLRGRMQSSGPITASQLGQMLGLDESRISATLSAIEGEGGVLRGQFTQTGFENNGLANGRKYEKVVAKDAKEVEWCDRRLLARIHRYTLEGLRRRIQPVTPVDYIRFLTQYHRLLPDQRRAGRAGVREVIAQLQGCEIPAGAWEPRILAARVANYDPSFLDELSLSGELMWGRLRPPAKPKDDSPSGARVTRAALLSLLLREDLGWLLPPDRESAEGFARSNAQVVWQTLKSRGALFPHELRGAAQLLPTQLEEALYELAALGLVTADSFGAIRPLVSPKRKLGKRNAKIRGHVRRINGVVASIAPAGRWSLFPGFVEEVSEEQRISNWVQQLLRRWGVVFRDVLATETLAPPWYRMLPLLRRMEARGELHGGRFISGVSGEQYATPEVVVHLRRVREEKPDGHCVIISAADPLNLAGIITDEPRVNSKHTSTLALRDGRLIASQQSGLVDFHDEISDELAADMSRRLKRLSLAV